MEEIPAYPVHFESDSAIRMHDRQPIDSRERLTPKLTLPLHEMSFDSECDEEPILPMPMPKHDSPRRSRSAGRRSFGRFPVSSYTVSDAPVRVPSRHVNFANSPTHSVHISEFSVEPYSEVYGAHPKFFDFDAFGNKMPRQQMISERQRQAFPGYHDSYASMYASYRSGTSEAFDSCVPYA